MALTVPLMVASLSVAIPLWIRNGYCFWVSRGERERRGDNHQSLGTKEVWNVLHLNALHLYLCICPCQHATYIFNAQCI